ncbi:hypothetical protein ACIA6D_30570 [Streptomyces cacaoi]
MVGDSRTRTVRCRLAAVPRVRPSASAGPDHTTDHQGLTTITVRQHCPRLGRFPCSQQHLHPWPPRLFLTTEAVIADKPEKRYVVVCIAGARDAVHVVVSCHDDSRGIPVRPGVGQAIVPVFERNMRESDRAAYDRSPLAKTITGLLQAPDTPRSQDDTLTTEITRLKRADRALRSQHAAEQREMRATIAAYANRIQVLSLRNAELEAENAALREHFGQADGPLTSLR